MPSSTSLEPLLDLDGFIAEMGGGYWVKIEAKQIRSSDSKPHGIDYSLTFHAPNGERILGYDNAHPVRAKKGPGGKKKEYDHRHINNTHRIYKYQSAEKLLEDFWRDVENNLREKGVN